MVVSRDQFDPRREYSRSGKPKKAHATQAEAERVAGLHLKTYGTVAKAYQGRDKQWYVTTDREATASNNVAAEIRRRAEVKSAMDAPLIASDIRTGEERHVGTGLTTMLRIGGMRAGNPRHGQYMDWVAQANGPNGLMSRLARRPPQ